MRSGYPLLSALINAFVSDHSPQTLLVTAPFQSLLNLGRNSKSRNTWFCGGWQQQLLHITFPLSNLSLNHLTRSIYGPGVEQGVQIEAFLNEPNSPPRRLRSPSPSSPPPPRAWRRRSRRWRC